MAHPRLLCRRVRLLRRRLSLHGARLSPAGCYVVPPGESSSYLRCSPQSPSLGRWVPQASGNGSRGGGDGSEGGALCSQVGAVVPVQTPSQAMAAGGPEL